MVAEIADALRVAHEAGIVHRDVKPGNVLLSTDGRVLVTDFGIAKASDGLELTGAGMTLGTAKYLSPEQVEGRPVDARADVYATGVVLYELVCGQPPFVADTELATALARVQRDPAPPRTLRPDVPPNLESIILRALARQPADRFQHASELRDALRAAGAGTPGQAGQTGTHTGAHVPLAPAAVAAAAAGPDATFALQRPADHTVAAGLPVAPPGAPPAPAPPPARVSPAQPNRRRRRWGLGLTLLLVLGAVGTAVALWLQAGDPRPPRDPFSRDDGADPVTIASVDTFDPDPPGDGVENDDAAERVLDGDAATSWRSECYQTPQFSGIPKDGVGLVLVLDAAAAVGTLRIEGGPEGWSGQVHVADAAAADVAGWGDPVADGRGRRRRTDGPRPRRRRGQPRAGALHRPPPDPERQLPRRREPLRHLRLGAGHRRGLTSSPRNRTIRRWSRRQRAATGAPSTSCCAATTTGSTPCAVGSAATTPTPSTPPRTP